MHVCISHSTALSYWLRAPRRRSTSKRSRWADDDPDEVPVHAPDDICARTLFDSLKSVLPAHISRLDISVSSAAGRAMTASIKTHLWRTKVPAGSFVPQELWGQEFYVSCPELVFLQLAEELEFDRLIYAGYALCSSFRLSDIAPGGCEHRDMPDAPLTSREKIKAYLDRIPAYTKNLGIARRALAYVCNGARSPMESGIAMLVSLPVRLGGYALGEVEMNREVKIYDGLDRHGNPRRITRIPDVLVKATDRTGKQRRVGIDYDAASTHDNPLRAELDIDRRNLLASVSNLAHVTLSTRHARSFYAFDQEMDRIRRALGQKKKPQPSGNSDSEKNRLAQMQAQFRRSRLWERVLGEERMQL